MTSKLTREWLQHQISAIEAVGITDSNTLLAFKLALAAMDSEPHTDDELSNLLWYSQEATSHSDPNYYCEFQRLATPGFIAWIIREVQELRKADNEPVGTLSVRAMSYSGKKFGTQFGFVHSDAAMKVPEGDYPLYRHAQPAPVVPDEAQSREAFEKWCSVNIERNKWHPEFYAHLPAREQWAAWEACRAAMLNGGKS